ncbi:hypothetical protein DICPUDRAFT_75469 [Dictyostelium purpureum]|uniref:Importin N-terminal domain-containing protein n=1 Tax=Dictyostelium purpureum TaxID=5786 RepID=F0ZAR4_DICPU|nr:uncharacterized protein DICPUDRAFT_75469 [Dictyostelium purpureum]EGC38931.1 hypothetical protein DICPUDRAFT_75469 [Dictyostelium purpureum]|eukprot:XP_003284496.1 hypothetical protein DICPUDRAFT_75469 [Dictyostelium purpureum]
MDQLIAQSIQLFHHTLHSDANVIKAAEEQLSQIKVTEGYSKVLLKILASNEVDISIRQSVAVFLKNMIIRRWRGVEDESPISESDAEFIRENLIDLLVHSHHLVQNQIEVMIEIIANRDFPEKWTSLLPKALQYINTQDIKLILAGLTSLQLGIKRYQYIPSDDKRRESLYEIIKQIGPLLLQILEFLANHQTVESAIMQKKIIKIYSYCMKFKIPELLVQPEVLKGWLNQFVRIIQRDISVQENSKFIEDCRKNHWWRLKKSTSTLLCTILRKSGKIRKSDPETQKQLSALFMPAYSIEIMKIFYEQLSGLVAKNNGVFYERYQKKLIEYFTTSVIYGTTYVVMKTFLNDLIQKILFPILCFNEKDAELWEDDPQEFLRSQFESAATFATPRIEALNFIIDVVGKRGRANLDSIMGFCIQKLNVYNSAADASQKNPNEKDGILIIIAVLSTYLKNIKFYRSNLEQMLLLHVFPELTSEHGFLRARACILFSEFYNIEFSNPVYFSNALKLILQLMSDKDLPVRIKAGMSICNLVRAHQGLNEIRPILPQLLDKIFSLLGEAESEELVVSIESIIQRFKHEIAPYATNLIRNLSEQFLRLLELEKDPENESVASQECLMVYCTLLRALKDVPDVFNQMENYIVPILQTLFKEDCIMYLEEALRILTFLTYYPKSISPLVWSLYPQIMGLFEEFACDFISSYVNPIDNFISYGTEVFFSTPQYIEAIFNMYKKMVGDIRHSPVDASDACKIMESVVQRGKGRIDNAIAPIMEIACTRLLNKEKDNQMSKEFMVYLIEIIANCIYYNPSIAIKYLESNNLVEPIFSKWFSNISKFQRFYDKKISVLAFSALLSLNPAPNFVIHGTTTIITMMLNFTVDMLKIEEDLDKKNAEYEAELLKGNITEEEEEEDELDEDLDDLLKNHDREFEFAEVKDTDDCEGDDDHEIFLDDLDKVTEYYRSGAGDLNIEDGEDDFEFEGELQHDENEDDEDEQLFEDEDTPDFETPIDDVDGFEYMLGSIQFFFQANPACGSKLTEDQQKKIQEYIRIMPERKEKLRIEKEKEDKRQAEYERKQKEKVQNLVQ